MLLAALLLAAAPPPALPQDPAPAPATTAAPDATQAPLPLAPLPSIPRWRGFNLGNKFHRDWKNGPFAEHDFEWIAAWGFNFARLPIDYRCWITGNDWTRFDESVLREIDDAVTFGRRHGIHVSVNFHRAPGYTVASPPEERSVWTDAEALRVCTLHWATFARRYRGIPPAELSFNLFNEPHGVSPADHARVVATLVAAIRAEDPDRLIICDGLEWGREIAPELWPLGVAQATRGYTPFQLSHWGASWIDGSTTWPAPTWPDTRINSILFGPAKADLQSPLVIEGPLGGLRLRLRVDTVSALARLVARSGDATLLDHTFTPSGGDGPWAEAVYRPEWQIWQNRYDTEHGADLPAGATRVELSVTEGDWLTLREITLEAPGGGRSWSARAGTPLWSRRTGTVRFDPSDPQAPLRTDALQDRAWLAREVFGPWIQARAAGKPVLVGEFGAWNAVPHDVVLRWMEDQLALWKENDLGWALWELSGSFGVLDSGRADVTYEDFNGRKLDRAMLDLLRRY